MVDLRLLYPQFQYEAGEIFRWSPRTQTITYEPAQLDKPAGQLSLLHEIAHGVLDHLDFHFDLELLRLEISAWQKTHLLAAQHGLTVREKAVERCLDTYRDWLFARSCCPQCSQTGLQQNSGLYRCLSCAHRWRVPTTQTCAIKRYAISS